jgi:hypothetical protein
MDLVNTVAMGLAGEDPRPLLVPQTTVSRDGELANPPPGSHVDLANSTEKTTAVASNSAPVMNAVEAPAAAERKPRGRLLKMNVWFTQDDVTLVRKISMARGQRPEDLIQLATLKLLAELGAVGEERKRLLTRVRG